jgi:hypothetical protein
MYNVKNVFEQMVVSLSECVQLILFFPLEF